MTVQTSTVIILVTDMCCIFHTSGRLGVPREVNLRDWSGLAAWSPFPRNFQLKTGSNTHATALDSFSTHFLFGRWLSIKTSSCGQQHSVHYESCRIRQDAPDLEQFNIKNQMPVSHSSMSLCMSILICKDLDISDPSFQHRLTSKCLL